MFVTRETRELRRNMTEAINTGYNAFLAAFKDVLMISFFTQSCFSWFNFCMLLHHFHSFYSLYSHSKKWILKSRSLPRLSMVWFVADRPKFNVFNWPSRDWFKSFLTILHVRWYPVITPFGSDGGRHVTLSCVDDMALDCNIRGSTGELMKESKDIWTLSFQSLLHGKYLTNTCHKIRRQYWALYRLTWPLISVPFRLVIFARHSVPFSHTGHMAFTGNYIATAWK